MATAGTQYSPAQVAAEVIRQGGSSAQAWVAAALVSGVESNGTLADKNPTSTACGLFQFLDTTWQSNGGTGTSACGASLTEQVSVFLTASSGNNFYPWAPDLGGAYTPSSNPISTPKQGSPVANAIASLGTSDPSLVKLLGGLPTNWTSSIANSNAEQQLQQGIENPPPLLPGNPLSGLSGLEKGVDDVLNAVTSASWWKRVGLFSLGTVLVIGGIILFVSTTKTGQRVESDAAVAAVA